MANVRCNLLTTQELLSALNAIFHRGFKLSSAVDACLQEFIDEDCDLGEVYGYLRPLVKPGVKFPAARNKWKDQSQKDYELRAKAIDSNHIVNPKVPPRRVWDLFANRVLPFYVLPERRSVDGEVLMPENLWPVSHSWVAPTERQYVLTTINGKAWHVPIPRHTTLDDIRNELLILGAEYVWLDVLCLRQEDESLPERESIRKREWRLDIPTIGHIYNEDRYRPTIVYFNGLGLPFLDRPADPEDRYHWLHRTWTLQECPDVIIPGGLENKVDRIQRFTLGIKPDEPWSSAYDWASSEFLADFRRQCSNASFSSVYDHLSQLKFRFCSNPVDQVACLAYLLRCPTLPIYDAGMDVEVAWSLLVECMNDFQRTQLLFLNLASHRLQSSWRPTWSEVTTAAWSASGTLQSLFLRCPGIDMLQRLHTTSSSLGYKYGLDIYYHQAYVITDVQVESSPNECDGSISQAIVRIPLTNFEIVEFTTALDCSMAFVTHETKYYLITVLGAQRWLIARPVGMRRIGQQSALEVSKISVLTIKDLSPSIFGIESQFKGLKYSMQLVAYR